jgi:long-chain acyl-CoA synthetase
MSGMIVSGARTLTRAALNDRAARAAAGLAATGLGETGAVAMLLRNDITFLEGMLAASTLGAYCVPINWHYTPDEVGYILRDSGATHLIVHSDLWPAVRSVIPSSTNTVVVATPPEVCAAYGIAPEDAVPPAGMQEWESWLETRVPWTGHVRGLRGSMFYTSGTTGRPKAVRREPIAPEDRDAYARLRAEWFGFRPDMRTAMIGPLYHSVQSTYAYAALQIGTVVLVPKFEAEDLLRLVEAHRLTHLHLVPTMMHRLMRLPASVRNRYDVSSLEFVIHGAAHCPADVKRQMIGWLGPIVHEYYGTSETGMVSRSNSHEWLAKEGTVGHPWPGRIVRVYDEEGRVLPPRAEGLIYMSLGMVPNFTYHNADARRTEIERDGLVTTGDIGYLDEDGYLFLCDRRHDVIVSGGVKIWPAEIESALSAHPDVADCAVFGIPHAEFGQVPAAAVELVPGGRGSADDLRAFLGSRLARFKLPRVIEISEGLPRDDSGKIFKRRLRDAYLLAAGATPITS